MSSCVDDLDRDDAAGERARRAAHARIQETKHAEFHALDLVLDVVHEDSPVVVRDRSVPRPDGADGDPRPGARLPHRWLSPGRSLYDALGPDLALLVPPGRADAAEGLVRAARDRGVPLTVLDVADPARAGARLVLVRPDQHVAWRGDQPPADPVALVDHVCGAAAGPAPVRSGAGGTSVAGPTSTHR